MKERRWIRIAVVCLMTFALLCALGFMVLEASHDCAGEDCLICDMLLLCDHLLKAAQGILLLAVLSLAITGCASLKVCFGAPVFSAQTPIHLKVKLLN